MRTLPIAISLALAALVACGDDGGTAQTDAANNPSIDAGPANPRVVMETTMGTMVLEIFERQMPITSQNFFAYVDPGWFDGTLIHRVENDWVIQGGRFATGMIEKTPLAPIQLETHPDVGHVHGAISMARTNDPNSATSQWFIVDWPEAGTPPQPAQLDGDYAAFGLVVEGLDVLRAITEVPVTGTPPNVAPVTEIVVTSVRRQ